VVFSRGLSAALSEDVLIRRSDRGFAAAAAVVRSVLDEYGFTWDEEGYHRPARRRVGLRSVLRRGLDNRIVGTASEAGR
jgi:hypothetical protein